jgi:SRSO17 transposase
LIRSWRFPKQGTYSVGVARQYCGALGKIANCQVAVTAALWTGARAWLLGALLYLPTDWLTDATRRTIAQIPTGVGFQEKWRQALTLIRRARAARLHVTAVLADAEFGDVTAFRHALHRLRSVCHLVARSSWSFTRLIRMNELATRRPEHGQP